MRPIELKFLEQTLGKDHKPYFYYKDKYALQLIGYYAKNGMRISTLKSSKYKHLLSKQIMLDVLKNCGDQTINLEVLQEDTYAFGMNYNYTISKWGEYVRHRNDTWYQTSRPGFNLVLQLNFDSWHNYKYCRLIKAYDDDPFVFDSHPVAKKRGFTMSWARLDIDLDRGEMLVEEIQNDWLREVNSLVSELEQLDRKGELDKKYHWFFDHYPAEKFREYANFLRQYQKTWDEATFSLAIHFAKQELGLNKIYYHDFESGNVLKGLEGAKPPKSLYTKLPKKFCFSKTNHPPKMIRDEKFVRKKLRKNNLQWWELTI